MDFEKIKSVLFIHGHDAIEDFLGYEVAENEGKDVLDRRLDEAYRQMPDEEYQEFVKKYAPIRYFECSYDNQEVIEEAHAANDQSILESSATQEDICIRALREPTIEEANEFLKNDIGEKKVWFVGELSRSEAYAFYDMEHPTRLFGAEGEVRSND